MWLLKLCEKLGYGSYGGSVIICEGLAVDHGAFLFLGALTETIVMFLLWV